jgi:tripartite-type tricarboxylate transporter receptor subunit TctC
MRRQFVAVALLALCSAVAAQGFPIPGKSVRIVVPTPPGGTTDIQARLIAPKLSEALGVPAVVDNKPGASTMIGAQEVARAAPDGHTLLYTFSITHTQAPHLFANCPYDPFRDFTPITHVARASNILVVHASIPVSNVRELVAYAKANPGKLNFGSFSPGSTSHLMGELLKLQTGIDVVHVPYKGSGDALKDLLSGRVQMMFDGPTTAIENAKTGRVKALAIAGPNRLAGAPGIPTMAEAGFPEVAGSGYLGFFGPAKLPASTLQRLSAELTKIVRLPDVSEQFIRGGTEPTGTSPEEFAQIVHELYGTWGRVIRQIDPKLQ